MTERKVLNKYFPPDYDPAKIPRMRRGDRRRQFNIRTMAPFNMRCLTCNGYIYKAKKFNSRMEAAENVDYLGLRHYRFYIRCPSCCAEIIWRTDLESGDYVLESGAKRNFEALKTAEELEAKRQAEEEEELANNPMKLLEKRTDQSKQEMEMVEVIEDLRQINERLAGMDSGHLVLRKMWQEEEAQRKAEEEADEQLIKELLAERSAPSACISAGSTDIDSTTTIQEVIPAKSSDSKDLVTPKIPHKSNTYMKRQLTGLVLVKKPASDTENKSDNSTPTSSSTNHIDNSPPASKVPKMSSNLVTLSEVSPKECNPLPGITYSDHSDSD